MPKKSPGAGKKFSTIIPSHEKEILDNLESKENASAYIFNLIKLDTMFNIENILKALVNNAAYTKENLKENSHEQENENKLLEELNKSEFDNLESLEEDDLL